MRGTVFLFVATFFSLNALAGEIKVEKDQVYDKSPDEILDILVDYENTCNEGCTYRVKGLSETRVLEKTDTQAVIWQRINDVRTVEQFVMNTIKRNAETGEITMASSYPSAQEIASLTQKTNLRHNGAFKSMIMNWRLMPDGKGGTRVFCEMNVVHGFPDIISRFIKNAVRGSVDTLFENFE